VSGWSERLKQPWEPESEEPRFAQPCSSHTRDSIPCRQPRYTDGRLSIAVANSTNMSSRSGPRGWNAFVQMEVSLHTVVIWGVFDPVKGHRVGSRKPWDCPLDLVVSATCSFGPQPSP
jgi:hypothetical protein